ncbi:RBBP9/YdeN family alpha/beta hydrolase [Kitasatospora azatica]|uniref:RBBP9/YdeN family alpha/beta hydrolase n=1 Tax=Kitasatospora azatica TaxID=58347 RepID=UPI00055FD1E3|nr:alpha/beta fold hydrolase [Kitasatospora azatica]
MSKIIVVHGYRETTDENWYPYLQRELTALGHEVELLRLPDPAAPQPAGWLRAVLAETGRRRAGDTVLIGHSLGGVNLLRLLAQHDTEAEGPFAGVVLVASMAGEVGYQELAGFFQPAFDWPRIRRAAREFRVLHAVDDPVTGAATPEHIMRFVTELGATATVTPTGGHFPTSPAPLSELPEALRLVRSLLPTG